MVASRIESLEAQVVIHKREIRRHRRELQVTVRTIEEFKARMAALGIPDGAAIGDDSHGPKQTAGT